MMTSDRIKVAGVMMSREEAAEVEAERKRRFGPRYRSLMPSNDPNSPPVVVFIVPIVLLAIGGFVLQQASSSSRCLSLACPTR